MPVKYILPADPPGIDDGPKTVRRALLAGQSTRQHYHFPQHHLVAILHMLQRFHMLLGNQHEMHLRHRIDVVEGEYLGVLVNLAAGNLTSDDLAEDAVIDRRIHSSSLLRADANSSARAVDRRIIRPVTFSRRHPLCPRGVSVPRARPRDRDRAPPA